MNPVGVHFFVYIFLFLESAAFAGTFDAAFVFNQQGAAIGAFFAGGFAPIGVFAIRVFVAGVEGAALAEFLDDLSFSAGRAGYAG